MILGENSLLFSNISIIINIYKEVICGAFSINIVACVLQAAHTGGTERISFAPVAAWQPS